MDILIPYGGIFRIVYAFVAKDKYELSELENKLESTPSTPNILREHDGEIDSSTESKSLHIRFFRTF